MKLTVFDQTDQWIFIEIPTDFGIIPPGKYKIPNKFDSALELFEIPTSQRNITTIDAHPDANWQQTAYGDYAITITCWNRGNWFKFAMDDALLLPLDKNKTNYEIFIENQQIAYGELTAGLINCGACYNLLPLAECVGGIDAFNKLWKIDRGVRLMDHPVYGRIVIRCYGADAVCFVENPAARTLIFEKFAELGTMQLVGQLSPITPQKSKELLTKYVNFSGRKFHEWNAAR